MKIFYLSFILLFFVNLSFGQEDELCNKAFAHFEKIETSFLKYSESNDLYDLSSIIQDHYFYYSSIEYNECLQEKNIQVYIKWLDEMLKADLNVNLNLDSVQCYWWSVVVDGDEEVQKKLEQERQECIENCRLVNLTYSYVRADTDFFSFIIRSLPQNINRNDFLTKQVLKYFEDKENSNQALIQNLLVVDWRERYFYQFQQIKSRLRFEYVQAMITLYEEEKYLYKENVEPLPKEVLDYLKELNINIEE